MGRRPPCAGDAGTADAPAPDVRRFLAGTDGTAARRGGRAAGGPAGRGHRRRARGRVRGASAARRGSATSAPRRPTSGWPLERPCGGRRRRRPRDSVCSSASRPTSSRTRPARRGPTSCAWAPTPGSCTGRTSWAASRRTWCTSASGRRSCAARDRAGARPPPVGSWCPWTARPSRARPCGSQPPSRRPERRAPHPARRRGRRRPPRLGRWRADPIGLEPRGTGPVGGGSHRRRASRGSRRSAGPGPRSPAAARVERRPHRGRRPGPLGLGRLALGSVSDWVLRHLDGSVLVARAAAARSA